MKCTGKEKFKEVWYKIEHDQIWVIEFNNCRGIIPLIDKNKEILGSAVIQYDSSKKGVPELRFEYIGEFD